MKLKKAFSFLEVAISILIISIVLATVLTSKYLIKESRVASAKSLTKDSPILHTSQVTLWLEDTVETSFKDNEIQDYQNLSSAEIALGKGSITKWYDRNPHPVARKNAIMSTIANAPKYYRDCVNDLPCLNFTSANQHYFEVENTASLTLNDYSIFIVDKRNSFGLMPLIGSNSYSSDNESLEIGYTDSDTVYWNQGGSTEEKYTISVNYQEKIKLHSFVNSTNQSGSASLYYYINSQLITADNPPATSDFSTLTLGSALRIGNSASSYYDGSICEIIIIPYAVSTRQRIEIQQYLLKKWKIQ